MITFDKPILGREEKELLTQAINQSAIAQGSFVQQFEQLFGNYCNVNFACGCINGTAALHLALASLGVKKDDEVIVPTFTFVASANVATYLGAKAVFVDIDKETLCIDSSLIEEKITNKTKTIMPVHVYGNVCDMDAINKIAKKHGLKVVEDAAEAHGATYKNKKAGSLSDIGCFSFYHNKIMTTGEGGMCLTNSKEINDKLRLLRAQGKVKEEELKGDDLIEKKYYHDMIGFNYRMTDLHAAIGIAQLKKLDENLKKRKKIVAVYNEEFLKYDLSTMKITKDVVPSCWVYPLIFKNRVTRLKVGRVLKEKNLPFSSVFWPCHKQPFYDKNEKLPVAEDISEKGLIIPCSYLMTEEEALNLAKFIGKSVENA